MVVYHISCVLVEASPVVVLFRGYVIGLHVDGLFLGPVGRLGHSDGFETLLLEFGGFSSSSAVAAEAAKVFIVRCCLTRMSSWFLFYCFHWVNILLFSWGVNPVMF